MAMVASEKVSLKVWSSAVLILGFHRVGRYGMQLWHIHLCAFSLVDGHPWLSLPKLYYVFEQMKMLGESARGKHWS